jgi:membrane-associated phospholipid phosphatase
MVVAVYLVAVRTRWGQRVDATALRGRHVLDRRAVHAAGGLLSTIDVASLAFVGMAIVVVSLVRSRRRLGLAAGAIIAGSVLTSEVLKRVALARPRLGVVDQLGRLATYPSGHTTVAMALGVAAMLVCPSHWRGAVTVVAVLCTRPRSALQSSPLRTIGPVMRSALHSWSQDGRLRSRRWL